jgi:hypothetical protein
MGSAWHIQASQFTYLTSVILEYLPPGIVTVNYFGLKLCVAHGDVDTKGVKVYNSRVSSDWLLSSSKEDHLIIILVVICGPGG